MSVFAERREGRETPERIMVRVGPTRWKALKLSEVAYVKANARSSRFFTVDGKEYPTDRALGELHPLLYSCGFRKCHRSYMVNLDYIELVVRRTHNDKMLILKMKGEVERFEAYLSASRASFPSGSKLTRNIESRG